MVGIIDVHSHILPEVDDGAQAIEESKEGSTCCYRPHFRRCMFESSMDKIEQQYQIKEIAHGIGEGMNVFLACEYHVNMT